MKKKIVSVFVLLMALTLMIGLVACGAPDKDPVIPPEPEDKVVSVFIVYDGSRVTNGIVSVDITEKSVALSAEVKVSGDADDEVMFASSNPDVAEINATGEVTLKTEGETFITAAAGDKKHKIVLIVTDEFSPAEDEYSVSVYGGTASAESAKEGEQIFLTADTDTFAAEHQSFVKWEYLYADSSEPIEDLWLNGNSFRMPAADIVIRAVLEDMLYTLNVVDGTIKTATKDGEPVEAKGTTDGDTTVYRLPYETNVTVQANDEKDGEMFVGWDYEVKKNRKGAPGQTEYSFKMPDETLTVFGIFSKANELIFGSGAFSNDSKRISKGLVSGESAADPDLEGMSGFRFGFGANKSANNDDYSAENLTGVNVFSTLRFGSQTVKVIFKNHSENQTLKLEFYAISYSTIATTGVVTVAPNTVEEKIFVAPAGFHNPSFALVLRESLTGSSDDVVYLDVVYETADTYEGRDPQFNVIDAEYAKLESRKPSVPDYPAETGIRPDCYLSGPTVNSSPEAPTGVNFGGRKNVNNDYGITNLITRDSYIDWTKGTPYLTAKYSNLPEYDPENPNVSVYFRVINTNNNVGTFDFGIGTMENPMDDANRVSIELELQPNEVKLFGLTLSRNETDDVYFTIIKRINDQTGSATNSNIHYDHNLIIQMMYNNKLGVQDENIHS